ncbi:rhomboid family intramembrane serine protease [Enterococcus nangangensis]|uniref:rhomboid family intramembrane serine protease n=1 Tax=Enterococcus nangangensis TaxID=2559926 RepID=UPI0010F89DF4|nr:rhomboid family intramembrane serine protease [Enterococcus nangangensis]
MKTSLKIVKDWRQRPYVTYFFLLLQTILFLWMEIAGYGFGGSQNVMILDQFGAMERSGILYQHEYWRFVLPIFLHIGWAHFAINSVTLYFIGEQVEMIYGHFRYFWLYLLSGVAGNVVSFAFGNANAISAGASTALFGLFAAFIVLGRLFKDNPAISMLVQRYLVFIGMNFIFNLFSSTVDMFGHIGGFVGGLLLAVSFNVPIKDREVNLHERIVSGVLFVFLLGILVIYGFKKYGFTI